MRRHTFIRIFAVTLFAVVFFISLANAHEEHPKTGELLIMECGKTTSPVVIDGKLGEWQKAIPTAVDVEEQLYDVFSGDWADADDCSGIVYMMYDDEYIYMAGEFKDDELIAGATAGTIWQNECVEIFFDPTDTEMDAAASSTVHYQFGFAPSGPNDEPQVWNWCNPDAGKAQQDPSSYIQVASVISDPYTGYTLEGSIKIDELDDLQDIIEVGLVIGFHIAIDDADENAATRDLQITWSSYEAHDQLHFGDLVFGEPLAVSPAGALTTTWGQIKDR